MTPSRILKTVSEVHGIEPKWIVSQKRDAHITAARHAAMTYLREYLGWSTPKVAAEVNRACHTTVLHGLRTHRRRLRHNTNSARAMDEACRRRLDEMPEEIVVTAPREMEAFQ